MKILIFAIILAASLPVFAGADLSRVTDILDQAKDLKLFDDPYWLQLGHYKPKSFGRDGMVSGVQTDSFFLSKVGNTSPEAEMVATIRAFFAEPNNEDLDAHAQCRFVARFKWLKTRLTWSKNSLPQVECAGFNKWSFGGGVDSISFIFASGYLDNPVSFFGHPLLKFNRKGEDQVNELFDTSLNYGAITPGTDNAIVYALKGLFGGYEAGFTHSDFFYHHHNYGENELRDLWVYDLDLNDQQVDQIVSHTWELLGNKFPYYFLHDNCAYRMSELLGLVISEPLLPTGVPYAIPYTVYDRLSSITKEDGKPLVKNVTRVPSRQSRLYDKYSSLDDVQQSLVKSITTKAQSFENPSYRSLPVSEKIDIVDTLLDHNSFRISNDGVTEQHSSDKRMLLLERLELPPATGSRHLSISDVRPPHEGQRPVMTRVSAIHNSKLGSGVEIRLRPAYYDLISPEVGRLTNSSLSVFDLKLAAFESQVILRQIDIINIETLNVARTDLPGDGRLAWSLRLGLESQDLSCSDCSVFRVQGGPGFAHQITPSLIAYAMLDGRLQTPRKGLGSVAAIPRIGLLGSIIDEWKIQLSAGLRTYIDGTRSEEPVIRIEQRFGNDRTWDVRVSYQELVARQFEASFSYYW
jgi:hypothetical protein